MSERTPCHYWLNLPRAKAIAVWAYSITSLLWLTAITVAAVVFGPSTALACAMGAFLVAQGISSVILNRWI